MQRAINDTLTLCACLFAAVLLHAIAMAVCSVAAAAAAACRTRLCRRALGRRRLCQLGLLGLQLLQLLRLPRLKRGCVRVQPRLAGLAGLGGAPVQWRLRGGDTECQQLLLARDALGKAQLKQLGVGLRWRSSSGRARCSSSNWCVRARMRWSAASQATRA